MTGYVPNVDLTQCITRVSQLRFIQTIALRAALAWTRRTAVSSELWLGYVAGALTFGWLLPWIGRKIK